jgi:hypothetical protein
MYICENSIMKPTKSINMKGITEVTINRDYYRWDDFDHSTLYVNITIKFLCTINL